MTIAPGFRLSPTQARLFALHGPRSSGAFITEVKVALDGHLDRGRLERAALRVAEAHEILRTRFELREGLRAPLMVIAPAELAWGARRGPFELARDVPWRAILSGGGARHELSMSLPAVVADGASAALLVELLAEAYASDGANEARVQYADVAEGMNELLEAADAADTVEARATAARIFAAGSARDRVDRMDCMDRFCFDRARGEPQYAPEHVVIDAENAGEERWLSAWVELLTRVLHTTEPMLGVAFDGRPDSALSRAIGPFARVLPLPMPGSIAAAAPWSEYQVPGSSAAAAFFVTRIPEPVTASGVRFTIEELWACSDRADVALHLSVRSGTVAGELRFDAARIHRDDAQELARQLGALLRGEDIRPTRPVEDATEQPGALSASRLVPERIAEQIARVPERIAVRAEDGELSYRALDARAEALARVLVEQGVGPESRVALCLSPSIELAAAMVAVWRAGAAWVPIDPAMTPEERLEAMIEHARVDAVIGRGPPVLSIRMKTAPRPLLAHDAAWIIFTSGTSGGPKPVVIEHGNAAFYLQAITPHLDLPDGARWVTVSSLAADLAYTAVLSALASGGTLVMIDHERALDVARLREELEARPYDALKITPSHLSALLAAGAGAAMLPERVLVFGGERLGGELVARVRTLRPELRILNHYGPTETTIGAIVHPLGEDVDPARPVPIGRPLLGVTARVLDAKMRPLPAWHAGELFLGGAQVGRGYLDRPELTAEKFLPDPWDRRPNARLYRTGDLVRRHLDGTIDFLGRNDRQIKLRGVRIELAEIESELLRHETIAEAAVLLAEEEGREPYLVAFVVPRPSARVDSVELLARLRARLPAAMTPNRILERAQFPRTRSGKIDYRALLASARATPEGRSASAPMSELEARIARLWAELLGVERVVAGDDFFELGGHSLIATQLIARVRDEHHADVSLRNIFEERTLSRFAEAVAEAIARGATSGGTPIEPIEPIDTPIERAPREPYRPGR